MEPALQTIANRVHGNLGRTLTLVEFARADLITALRVFGDDLLSKSRVIYVDATRAVRAARLEARAGSPQLQVTGEALTLMVPDDHRLPSVVADSLYAADNNRELNGYKAIAGRVTRVHNNENDPTFVTLDRQLDDFISGIIRPYNELVESV